MIIIYCQDDQNLVGIAQQSSQAHFATFGNYYQIFIAPIPQLGVNEDLFIIAHGAFDGDNNVPVIGDQAAAFYTNGVELWENIQSIFPQNYTGSVYVDACESADHDEETFSFTEVFMTQIQATYGASEVYGRNGTVAGMIPLPTDPQWVQAT